MCLEYLLREIYIGLFFVNNSIFLYFFMWFVYLFGRFLIRMEFVIGVIFDRLIDFFYCSGM